MVLSLSVSKPTSSASGPTSTFVQRQLTFKFTRASGNFTGASGNELTVQNLRASAKISNAGGSAMGQLDAEVYGLTASVMADLSTLGVTKNLVDKNQVVVLAGNAGGQPTQVFQGTIWNAWIDFTNAPNVPFRLTAFSLGFDSVVPSTPSNYSGSTSVATIMQSLASKMGLAFENNGVSIQLDRPSYSGTYKEQAQRIVEDTGIGWNAGENGVLAIWPPNGNRGSSGITISPSTGMVGYPTYTENGIEVKALFNPQLKFGQTVQVQSSLFQATKSLYVYGLDHTLESLLPNGDWFSIIRGFDPNTPSPPLPVQ